MGIEVSALAADCAVGFAVCVSATPTEDEFYWQCYSELRVISPARPPLSLNSSL